MLLDSSSSQPTTARAPTAHGKLRSALLKTRPRTRVRVRAGGRSGRVRQRANQSAGATSRRRRRRRRRCGAGRPRGRLLNPAAPVAPLLLPLPQLPRRSHRSTATGPRPSELTFARCSALANAAAATPLHLPQSPRGRPPPHVAFSRGARMSCAAASAVSFTEGRAGRVEGVAQRARTACARPGGARQKRV